MAATDDEVGEVIEELNEMIAEAADDVWVTGISMNRHRNKRDAIGIVAFTRNPVESWVFSLIQLSPEAEEATYQLDRRVPQ